MAIEPVNGGLNTQGTGTYDTAAEIFTRGSNPQLTPVKGEDSLALSPQANSMNPLLDIESFLGFTPKVPGRVSVEEIESHAKESLRNFNRNMMSLFKENGIDTGIPIALGNAYGTGNVIVTNNHPDKEKIEFLFEENFELRNEQIRIGNMFSLVNAAKNHTEFAKAYGQSPQAAVKQYAYLFTTDIITTMILAEDEASILFSRS